MKMKAFYVLSLLALAAFGLAQPNELPAPDSPERTQDCCHADKNGRCEDGTQGTPYCGYRSCNIFGCNCDGGCRHR
ncbi:hypothetical protein COH20_003054 [Aspergillus flavus]|nr:hypothetical protein COH20_003054 [Aspergillus flavus]